MSDSDQAAATPINELSDRLVADLCRISPTIAIWEGRSEPGDTRLDDLSPDGLAALRDLAARAIADIGAAPSTGDADDVAREVILERLGLELDKYDSGWAHAQLNVIDSPLQHVRMIFDIMPTATEDDWSTVAGRMAAVPAALDGYRQSLGYAAERGQVAARRQVDKCAEQCATYAGADDSPGFFSRLAASAGRDGALGSALAEGAAAADAAYGELGRFLTDELRGRAPERDAVGAERYALASRDFLGDTVDLAETYRWGWQEFLAIEAELREVAQRIAPGQGPAAAAAALDADPAHRVHGVDGLQAWMQGLSDAAVTELGRTHFEIPDAIRTLECRIAPPGGGVGAYYTGPSDDLSRPGRMWWSVEQGRQDFSTWRETTTVYHEGVPGHHLQIATSTYQREHLNDFQRSMAGTSGHAEGWALYAERLVRELGYLDDDGNLLGMLDSQLFRAARVVVDIGMHLELAIPPGTGFHEGERWTPELGLEFLLTRTITDPVHCRDEIDRYLGWPGQAPAYKVGERVWLEGRADARRRHGAGFDLKAFHTAALNMGGMGLGPLTRRLATL
jgi:uncharacterized protein (DUF885 family)